MRQTRVRKTTAAGFTIVELLTVMSIVIILIGLLVPAMNRVKQYAKQVKQKAQFHSIDAAIEMFSNEFDGYPDSDEIDIDGQSYCGAMKLAEALVGQDMLGFHKDSLFNAAGVMYDNTGTEVPLYMTHPAAITDPSNPLYKQNLRERKGPFLDPGGAEAYSISDLYGLANVGAFPTNLRVDNKAQMVICDQYPRVTNFSTGKKVGMPILYCKADISKLKHDPAFPDENIYDSRDNQELVDLELPWNPGTSHPMAAFGTTPDGEPAMGADLFYEMTRDENVSVVWRPRKPDTYILISAGYDGLFGTEDDVFNFQD